VVCCSREPGLAVFASCVGGWRCVSQPGIIRIVRPLASMHDRYRNLFTMTRKLVTTLVVLAVLIGVPAAIKLRQFSVMSSAPMDMPPETVTADSAHAQSWPDTITAVGSLVAVQGVTVGTELGGKIVEIAFESGDRVGAGAVLVRLDTAAEAAQLRAAEAAVTLARLTRERSRELYEQKNVSKAEFDSADARFKQATAEADTVRAAIEKKTIRAPFAGRLGLRLVNLGQILGEGDPIVTLQTLDPIHVNFSVPQQLNPLLAQGMAVRVSTDAAPQEIFTGTINAVSPEIDAMTRNVRAQALIANVGEQLRAGMFVNVEVALSEQQDVLAIPATAVLYAPYGDTVFVIDTQRDEQSGETRQVLRQQIVRLGETRGDFVAVTAGLQAGDQVVTSGVFKLRPGMAVVVDNTLAPDAQLAPAPANE
jgi:membrane fusion protein (multidrug efflux system)